MHLLSTGPKSTRQLADAMGVDLWTVRKAMARLKEAGKVRAVGFTEPVNNGRPSVIYERLTEVRAGVIRAQVKGRYSSVWEYAQCGA